MASDVEITGVIGLGRLPSHGSQGSSCRDITPHLCGLYSLSHIFDCFD